MQIIKQEGIYFFGGKTQKDLSLNTVFILKMNEENVLTLCQPEVKGRKPLGRY